MGWTLLTVAAAAGGGLLLMRLRVPGGMLVGAILGAVLVNLTTGQAYIWPQTRVVAQVLTGAYIGCLVTTEDLRHLPRVIRPYLAVMSTFLALNLAVGFFIWRVTDLDLLTSLFCAAPGGMTDTPLIALDMGADASMVAVMQFVRMVFGMACLPSIIVLADRKIEGDQMVPEEGQGTHSLEKKKGACQPAEVSSYLRCGAGSGHPGQAVRCAGGYPQCLSDRSDRAEICGQRAPNAHVGAAAGPGGVGLLHRCRNHPGSDLPAAPADPARPGADRRVYPGRVWGWAGRSPGRFGWT